MKITYNYNLQTKLMPLSSTI